MHSQRSVVNDSIQCFSNKVTSYIVLKKQKHYYWLRQAKGIVKAEISIQKVNSNYIVMRGGAKSIVEYDSIQQ